MTVRILADDLTGALDTAAGFTGDGPVTVRWDLGAPAGECIAMSSETREAAHDEAVARVTRLAAALPGPGILLKKVDSLLRGHVAAEIAATMRAGGFARAIFAPAFPDRGRVTRNGMQHVRSDAGLQMIETDVGAELRRLGIATCTEPAALAVATTSCVWLADAQFDVDGDHAGAGQRQSLAHDSREPGKRVADGVRARRQVRDPILARRVGDGAADFLDQRRTAGLDRHAWQHQARGIADHACQGRLSLSVAGEGEDPQEKQRTRH